MKSPLKGTSSIGVGIVMFSLWLAEELAADWVISFFNDIWLAIAIGLLVAGLLLFPFGSIKNPKQSLKFIIKWIDFRGIYEIEPTIVLFLKIENRADIDQTVNSLKAELSYSADYKDDTFPEHPLQHHFTKTKQVIKAKTGKLLNIRTPILPVSAERFKQYIDKGQYIFWSGTIDADISAKILVFERGGTIEKLPLPKSPIVPTSRYFEGIEELF